MALFEALSLALFCPEMVKTLQTSCGMNCPNLFSISQQSFFTLAGNHSADFLYSNAT